MTPNTPSKNPAQRIRDLIENIDAAQSFVQGMRMEDFVRDQKSVYAVVRALEIISEASRRLPGELKERHAHIDWAAIAAAGNVFRHEYEVVDPQLIWRTVLIELVALRAVAATELAGFGL